jgi:hypothetical protein
MRRPLPLKDTSMGWFSRLISGSPKPSVPQPAPPAPVAPKAKTPAERRTYVLSGSVACAEFSSDYEQYSVDVVTGPDHYDALASAWVTDRPERCQTVYLRPDPQTRSGVLVQRSPATTLGQLSPVDASLYRGLIEAIVDLGLECTAAAKTTGGTGERQRLKLKLSLDSPQQIGNDFEVAQEKLAPRAVEDGAAKPRKVTPVADPLQALPLDHPRFVAVVGESHYQEALRRLAANGQTAAVTIEGEPNNLRDGNAVRVADSNGETLGYLAKGQYTQLKKIARTRPLTCLAELCGGTPEKPSVGLVVDLGDAFSSADDSAE